MRHDVVLRFVAMILFCFTLTGCIHYEYKSAEKRGQIYFFKRKRG
ncbi:hypothetical protein ABIC88_002720 [Pseudomonas kilonensis]